MQDCFTKWCEAYPLKQKKPGQVVDALCSKWITRYGIPYGILSDNGMEFSGKIYKDVMRHLGVKRLNSAPYYPRSNGMVERLNGTLQDMIKAAIRETTKGWVDVLPFVTASYRSAVHSTTGYSPNMMVLGRELPLTADIMLKNTPENTRCPVEYTNWLRNSLLAVKEIAAQAIAASQVKSKAYHDRKLKPREIHVHDLVLRQRPVKYKLASKWIGPYKVVEISGRTVMIEDDTGIKRADISQLRRYKLSEIAADTIFLRTRNESDSDSSDDDMPWDDMQNTYDQELPRSAIYMPQKPCMSDSPTDNSLLAPLEDSESETDEEDSDEIDSELDISLDGQVGRGFTHEERQEMASTTTRFGRVSRPPQRLTMSALELNAQELTQPVNNVHMQRAKTNASLTEASQNASHNAKHANQPRKSVDAEMQTDAYYVRDKEKYRKRNVEDDLDCHKMSQETRKTNSTVPGTSKKVKFQDATIMMLHWSPANCITKAPNAITSKAEKAPERHNKNSLSAKDNAPLSDQQNYVTPRGTTKRAAFNPFWVWLQDYLTTGDVNATELANKLTWIFDNDNGTSTLWKEIATHIQEFLDTCNSAGTKWAIIQDTDLCDNDHAALNNPPRRAVHDLINSVNLVTSREQASRFLKSLDLCIKEKGECKDYVSVDNCEDTTPLVGKTGPAQHAAADPVKSAPQYKIAIHRQSRITRQKNPYTVISKKTRLSDKHWIKSLNRRQPIVGKIWRMSHKRNCDESDTETDDDQYVVIDDSEAYDSRVDIPASYDDSPIRRIFDCRDWANATSYHANTDLHSIRAGITRYPGSNEIDYYWPCNRDTIPRYRLYDVPTVTIGAPCPFGCPPTKGGIVAFLEHFRSCHQPMTLQFECPVPYCRARVHRQCMDLTHGHEKHEKPVGLAQWQIVGFGINPLYGGEQYITPPDLLRQLHVDLNRPIADYNTRHWQALAFLFEQSWLSLHGQNSTNYHQIIVPTWVALQLVRGPHFDTDTIAAPLPDRANRRLRNGDIVEEHVQDRILLDNERYIGHVPHDINHGQTWDEAGFRVIRRRHGNRTIVPEFTPVSRRTRQQSAQDGTKGSVSKKVKFDRKSPERSTRSRSSDKDKSHRSTHRSSKHTSSRHGSKSQTTSHSDAKRQAATGKTPHGYKSRNSAERVKRLPYAPRHKLTGTKNKGCSPGLHYGLTHPVVPFVQRDPAPSTQSIAPPEAKAEFDLYGGSTADLYAPSSSSSTRTTRYDPDEQVDAVNDYEKVLGRMPRDAATPLIHAVTPEDRTWQPLPLPRMLIPSIPAREVTCTAAIPSRQRQSTAFYESLAQAVQQCTIRDVIPVDDAPEIDPRIPALQRQVNALTIRCAIQEKEISQHQSTAYRDAAYNHGIDRREYFRLQRAEANLTERNAALDERHIFNAQVLSRLQIRCNDALQHIVKLLQANAAKSIVTQAACTLLADSCDALQSLPKGSRLGSNRLCEWLKIHNDPQIDSTRLGVMDLAQLTHIYNELHNRVFVLCNASATERDNIGNAEGACNPGHPPVGFGYQFLPRRAVRYMEETMECAEGWEGSVAQLLLSIMQDDLNNMPFVPDGNTADKADEDETE